MDIKDIRFLLDAVAKSGTSDFSLETPDYKVTIKRGATAQVQQASPLVTTLQPPQVLAPSAPPATESPKTIEPAATKSSLIDITAPIVGTFYASPSPDAAAYVKVGDRVEKGKVLCIIEAMKLMNEIEAEMAGTITEVLVKNEEPVEYGQVLFRVSP